MSDIEVTILSPNDLRFLLIDSLKEYSENVQYIAGNNPYLISVNKKRAVIYIKNISDSGKGRGNQDECRIQISKTTNFDRFQESGDIVLFLGYSSDYKVFTAWNPFIMDTRINERQTISLYSRFSVLKKTQKYDLALYVDSNDQHIVSFQPRFLGLYIDNFIEFHKNSEDVLLSLTMQNDKLQNQGKSGETNIKIEQRSFNINHQVASRSDSFRKKIYQVYGNRCAFCNIQLELIEAAHIIPFSNDHGIDNVTNGICLCSLHHKAYDNALLYFDRDYQIKINNDRISYLTKIKLDGGYHLLTSNLNKSVNLPTSDIYRPDQEYIVKANEIRGVYEIS